MPKRNPANNGISGMGGIKPPKAKEGMPIHRQVGTVKERQTTPLKQTKK